MAAIELSRDFQEGLEALEAAAAERKPPMDTDVRAVGKHGGNVVVRLGVWPTDSFRPEYSHDEYVVFVRIPEAFPTGGSGGKGFATVPPLDRDDRPDLENNPGWGDGLARTVEQEAGVDEAESYSYNWEHATMQTPEDMTEFLGVAREFLSRG